MTNSSSSGQVGQIDFMHWFVRLIAYIIDAIIIAIVTIIIDGIVAIALLVSGGGIFLYGGFWLFTGIFGLLSILYFIILDVAWGATIGKRLMGLQVQTIDGGGISIDKSFIRNISKIFWLFLLLDWLIAVVTAGADRRQKLTDRWAGTTVIQTKQVIQTTTSPPSSTTSPPPAPQPSP